ncbi:hypothetical protein V2J09_003516 [Rumex salicifolius]
MAGLLAWAVGRGGHDEDGSDPIPLIFNPEQEQYARELDRKAATLSRSIQDLRLRIPPPDISQRLPHLHAHSLASNAALALQLNSHSATREQAQQREVKLLEENTAYEKDIMSCKTKIQEKLQEAEQLHNKLKELDIIEGNLRAELENAQAVSSSSNVDSSEPGGILCMEAGEEASKSALSLELDSKQKELVKKERVRHSMESKIQALEKKWAEVQEKAMKLPSPAQREKALNKQLYSLIEQLASKQAQAEGLVNEIHVKEKELERLNATWRKFESSTNSSGVGVNPRRNRFMRSGSEAEFASADIIVDDKLPLYAGGGRSESQQRLRLLRSSFVLYILLLHILVFIRISF